jgi:hypothetical protein
MTLNIPTNGDNIGTWGAKIIQQCHSSLENRRQQGAAFRNLYLTGSEEGNPQTYKKTYTYINTIAALFFSPAELRFLVAPTGAAGPRERSMGRAAGTELHSQIRSGHIDSRVEQAVKWALVKGKCFIQLEWTRKGLQAYMVQPETMGVLRDDLDSLDKQDAFVHSTWLTPARFADQIANHPKRDKLMRDIKSFITTNDDRPDTADNSRQVIIGGQLYPYRAATAPGAGQGRGMVNWRRGPAPELDSKTLASLIRLDELWVWDRLHDDWATFQLVGNVVIEPTNQHRNLFADGAKFGKGGRRVERANGFNEHNPLSGHQPFIEICPNPLPDYFWGWSEMMNVSEIQVAINNRVDGINRLLRRQEDPSWIIAGINTSPAKAKATLRRPGGYLVEPQAGQLKVEKMSPDLPAGLWESLHELEAMFDAMGGLPPVTQGQGEAGVRAQGHAETLVRMASTRFKDRAIGVERQVEEVGGLSLDLLRAHCADMMPYWVNQKNLAGFEEKTLDPLLFEPPAPGLAALPFSFHHLDDRYKVTVDSHSASPIFAMEERELAVTLLKAGAISPEGLIRQLHPVNEQELIDDLENREAAKAAFIEQHPELLMHGRGGRQAKH